MSHLETYPTLSMEVYRGIPLGECSQAKSQGPSADKQGSDPTALFVVLDGNGPIHEGERVRVVGGVFAISRLAAGRSLDARWAGPLDSAGTKRRLRLASEPLLAVATKTSEGDKWGRTTRKASCGP